MPLGVRKNKMFIDTLEANVFRVSAYKIFRGDNYYPLVKIGELSIFKLSLEIGEKS